MTGIRQRVAVDFVDREPLGLVFREDLKGGFIEVIRVKSGGAAERMGVRVGWKVAVVDEKRMDHVKFDAVMRHLHNQRRPLRVCFERGAEPERVNTHFEVAVRSPTGAVLPVLVPTQNGRGSTTGQLKQLLVTQHARLLPADALRLVENTPIGSDSARSPWGVRQQSAWGETAQTELPNHTRLTELTRRLQVGNAHPPRGLVADSVHSGTDPASCAQRGSFLSLTVDQPHRASALPRPSNPFGAACSSSAGGKVSLACGLRAGWMDSRSSTSAHGAVPQTSTKGLIDAKLEALEHSYGLSDASPPQPRGEPQLIPSGFRVSPPATPPMTPTPGHQRHRASQWAVPTGWE